MSGLIRLMTPAPSHSWLDCLLFNGDSPRWVRTWSAFCLPSCSHSRRPPAPRKDAAILQQWLSAVGIIVQIGIAVVGGFIAHSVGRAAAEQKKRDDSRVAQEKKLQERRDRLHAFDGYRRELGGFADIVIDVMGEIQTLIAFNPDRAAVPAEARQQFIEQRSKLVGRVSSLIDRGRLFFPNREVVGIGEDRGPAQQGLRDPVLNRIMAASHVLMATDYERFDRNTKTWIRWKDLTNVAPGREGHVCSAFRHLSQTEQGRLAAELKTNDGIRLMELIVSSKRAFVSEVFDILQPARWREQVEGAYGIDLSSRKPEGPTTHLTQK